MQITVHTGEVASTGTDLLILPMASSREGSGGGAQRGSKPARGGRAANLLAAIDRALGGTLIAAAREQDVTGKVGQRLVLHTLGKLRAKRVCVLGMGAPDQLDAATAITLGGHAARVANAVGARSALLVLPDAPDGAAGRAAAVVRGLVLGAYRYTRYRDGKGRPPTLSKVQLHVPSDESAAVRRVIEPSKVVADAVCLARDLANESPLQLYPESLAARAATIGRKHGLTVKIFDPPKLQRMKMNLLLGVGQGSQRAPRLVHLAWTPKGGARGKTSKGSKGSKKGAGPVVLVGKGITFDSGGLSLKPTSSMVDMKIDMHGAATVLATMQAVARLRLNVPVHGILALAENMPSGTAIRPSDVIESASGKTVEITNTDAEGRLVLADALHYAVGLKPARIIDLATLTGACMVALGPSTAGLFSNQDDLREDLLASARATGEDIWPLPLTSSLRSQLDSDVADLRNSGDRWGGAIIAALFLKEFVGDVPWAHIDIAGPASSTKDSAALTKGGTGFGVAALIDHLSKNA